MTIPVLAIRDLDVVWQERGHRVQILDGVSLSVVPGETVALVGESGAGKTILALAVMGLLPTSLRVARGSVRLEGKELVGADERVLRATRGARMAMVFQDAMSSLHPAFRVGDQIAETLLAHRTCTSRRDARARAVELLASVGIADAARRARGYPHELSGGMRQRAMIAMAIANQPRLLIADEATTGLDVTVQAQVLDVLRDVRRTTSAALLVITHDLGVVAGLADRVVVLYAGRVVEEGPVDAVLTEPAHPYTRGLLQAVPRLGRSGPVRVRPIPGAPPAPERRPAGCAFHPRCAYGDDRCVAEVPVLEVLAVGRRVACHHHAHLPAFAGPADDGGR